MSEKTLKGRVVQKHDTASNWEKATGFIPKKGEIIIYDIDANHNYERIKVGDGTQNVNALPFVTDALEAATNGTITTVSQAVLNVASLVGTKSVSEQIGTHNTSETAHSDIRSAINDVSTLVGDRSVSEQIAAANMIYVGPNRPEDPNIKVWINTAEEGTGVVPVLPRMATITLPVANWTGSVSPYYQAVSINTVTSSTKIDLQPTVTQITALQNADIALMAENVNGTVKVYSFGGKPSADMTMQTLLTEVSYV